MIFIFDIPIAEEAKPRTPKQRQEDIIHLLKESGPLSAKEIYCKLGLSISLRRLKTDLSMLRQQELIEKRGKARSTIWQIATE